MARIKETYKELAIEFQKTKNEKIYNKLYKKMRPGLWSYIFKIVKDKDATDDLCSTTLTKVYLKIDDYKPEYQITTWAYRIAFNDSLGWLKYQKNKISMNVFTDNGIDPPVMDFCRIEHDSDLPITDEDYHNADKIQDTQYSLAINAIEELPLMYKPYMVERLLNNKSYNEILDMMIDTEDGITLQTVKNRIFRGKKIVKKEIEKMYSLS